MDITFTTIENTTEISLPVTFIFWGYIVAYVIHLIDETVMGETFVGMVQRNFGPIQWKHFFIGNTLIMSLAIGANIVYEILGHGWIILPLTFVFIFTTNGIWHLAGTIISKKYSPGLASSLLYWLLFYFIFRYSILPGEIPSSHSIPSAIIGTTITVLMIGTLFLMRKKYFPNK
jgi:hypothetical protein